MRVSATKTKPRIERDIYLTSKKIKAYGQGNDYPQKILEIINSSGTGKTCMDVYVKFIEGDGFTDQVLGNSVINSRGEKTNTLLRKFAKDLKSFNGFSCLVKYDGLGMPTEFFNVPFEHCRLEIDSDKNYTGRIAVHPDWTSQTGLKLNIADVKYINHFDPSAVIEQMTDVGGPLNYLGQILYCTADGDHEYPISPFDPVVTDMLTEESVSTVKHRNAKFNFLPSGILVRKGKQPRTLDNGQIDTTDPVYQEQSESAEMIKKMQGDENASKIWVVDVDADEEKPEFIDFSAKNFDKTYELTETTVQDNIGRMFMIPPILRGVDIGAGFGADLMKNAYDFMNSATGNERRIIEVAFADLFRYYRIQFSDFSIEPIVYVSNNEKVNTTEVVNIVTNTALTPEQKVQLLTKLFSIPESDARQIIGI